MGSKLAEWYWSFCFSDSLQDWWNLMTANDPEFLILEVPAYEYYFWRYLGGNDNDMYK